MTERDEGVGRAIATLRGLRSQAAIADAMRERGWKWSQATVWSVEKGERPLRLLEANDLAEILSVQIEDFFGDKAAARQESEFLKLQSLIHKQSSIIRDAAYTMLIAQDELRALAEAMGLQVPATYQEAVALESENSRAKQLFFSIEGKDAGEEVELAKHRYEAFKKDPDAPTVHTVSLMRRVKEVQNGEHPETS